MKAPVPLADMHSIDQFDCRNVVMNHWLKERARANQESGATRTFVVCDDDEIVAGYYALAVGSCRRADAPGTISRGMPEPVPMMILARLAVDCRVQKLGLARQLVANAVMRTLHVAEHAGVRGLMVSAIDPVAAAYYGRLGFIRAKHSEDILMLRLKVAATVVMGER